AATGVAAAAAVPGPGTSGHAAALAMLPGRLSCLESRVAALADRQAREPLGVDPLERQQLDRLAGLLGRLRGDTGSDVRDTAARDTWRLVSLSQRGPPPLTSAAGPNGGGGGGSAVLGSGVPHGDYSTVSGGPYASDYYYCGGAESSGSAAGGGGG
ncbi:hypothetical protein VaNZ11_014587, partial [Volvox africanus]